MWPTRATTESSSTGPKEPCADAGARATARAPAAPARATSNIPRPSPWTPSGNVYVADTGNDRIVKLDAAGTVIAEWGATGGADGRFRAPDGIALDAGGKRLCRSTVKTIASRSSTRADASSRSGAAAAPASASSPSRTAWRSAAKARSTWRTRTTTASSGSNLAAAAPSGCEGPGRWPPPLDVAPVLKVTLAHSSGVLARRGLSLKSPASGPADPRQGHPGDARPVTVTALARGRRSCSPACQSRSKRAVPVLSICAWAGGAWPSCAADSAGDRGLLAHVTILATGQTGRRTRSSGATS